MTKIAFVPPWYGADIPGGAEAYTRRTAEELHRRGFEVEVLTTCVRDFYADWSYNHYREGLDEVNGVPVHRFRVRQRDRAAFDAVNVKLMHAVRVTPEEERLFIEEMIHSEPLYRFIAEHRDEYVFFFIPYMFGTTVRGAMICPERSWLIPCLHDESYARLSLYRPVFRAVRGLWFLSEAEMELAQRLYGLPARPDQHMVLGGGGVDTGYRGDAAAFRHRTGIEGPFVLYAGRKDVGKNLPLLIDYFRRYRQERDTGLALVLIGGGPLGASRDEGIIDLGWVSEREKFDAYAAATVLCQPSLYESFSLVMIESWVAGTPVLVHADCAVTVEHCRKANGGLYFRDYEGFAACLDLLLARPDLRQRLGHQGRAYVLAHCTWDVIAETYRRIADSSLRSE